MRGMLVVALVAALARSAAAQPPHSQPGHPQPAPGRAAREEAFKMVDAYVVSNLQESLGLSDEVFAKAIPLVKKLQTERREHLLERARLVREMRRLMREGGAVEPQVLERLERLKTLEAEGPERTKRNLAALDALFTPIQQARYRVLEGEVEQRVRELTNRARTARPGRQQRSEPEPE